MEATFEKQRFTNKLKSMLKVDFKRMFTMPLVYIMAAVCLAMPILILVMTTVMGGEAETATSNAVTTFTNVWQIIGSVSSGGQSDAGAAAGMDLMSMCNVNLVFFLIAVFVCIFVAEDFRSGYVKNLFTVRAKRVDYCASKTIACFAGAVIMIVAFFIGAMIGGGIAGLSFDAGAVGAGSIFACMLAKIFVALIFVAIALLLGVVAKQRLWLSVLCSITGGALLFSMIPMVSPLDSSALNVLMCFAGGALFAAGLGAVSNVVLNKTSLV